MQVVKAGEPTQQVPVQQNVIEIKQLTDRLPELMTLKAKENDAKAAFKAAVEAVAGKAGLLPAVVRKFINARSSGNFDDHHNQAAQLAIVFEEVGENEVHKAETH